MKKVLIPFVSLLLAIFMSSEIALAQGGNLQFNQVINHNLTGTANLNFVNGAISPLFQTLSITIPQGKVWKIESSSVSLKPEIITNGGDVFSYGNDDQTILTLNSIDLVKEIIGEARMQTNVYGYSSGSRYSPVNIKYPFWMPSGTYNLKLWGIYSSMYPGGGTLYRANGFLSAIEYNIVP